MEAYDVEIQNLNELLHEPSCYCVVLDLSYAWDPLQNLSMHDLNSKLTFTHANMEGDIVYGVVFIIIP